MSVYMIGTVYRDFKELVGFRLYDTETREYKDCTYDGVVGYIAEGRKVINLGLSGDRPVPLNGGFERYAKYILKIGIAGKSPLVVIKKYANGDYEVVNGQGDRARMGESYLINYSYTEGLANAYIQENKVYPIAGEFEAEKVVDPEKQIKKLKIKTELVGGSAKFLITEDGLYEQLDKDVEIIKVPEGVKAIAPRGFNGCKAKEVKFPKSLETTSEFMFMHCPNIRTVKLPVGCKKVVNDTFAGSQVEIVYLPATITIIEANAFKRATRLKKIYYSNRNLRNQINAELGTERILKR